MQPCTQATVIVKIETTLDHVVTLLEKHEEREGRMLDAMEVVAGQTEAIKAMHEAQLRQDKDIDTLFVIYREHIEKDTKEKPEKTVAIQLLESKYNVYILGGIFFCFAVDAVANLPLVRVVWNFWKSL